MKMILFGVNMYTEIFLRESKYEIQYVVDNDLNKLNKKYILPSGKIIRVKKPEIIKLEEKGTFLILIMTQNIQHTKEIEAQLKSYDLEEEKDFIHIDKSKLNLDFLNWNVYYNTNIIEKKGIVWPRVLHLGLSDVCNLKCKFCGFHGIKTPWEDSGHFMTMEVAKRIVNQVQEIETMDTLYITHDGEDLLNKEWFEIVQLVLTETKIKKFTIYTNGMLLNDENIYKLRNLNADKVKLVVSIDGKNSKENNEIRKGSNYEIIKNNIYKAQDILDDEKYKIIINNNYILDEQKVINENYIFNEFSQVVPDFLKEDFERKGLTVLSTPTIYLAPKEMGFPQNSNYKFIKARKSYRISGCFNPFEVISINAQGDILYCGCNVTQDKIGNVHEDDILKVWQTDAKLQNARKRIRDIRETPDLCVNCPSKIDGEFYIVCR